MTGSSSSWSGARWLTAPALALVLALGAACTKSESGAPAPTTESTTTTPEAPRASAAPANTAPSAAPADSAPSAAPADSAPADTPTAAAKAAADAGRAATEPKSDASSPAASGSQGAAECGTKPLPDCPLQAWMKLNANPPVMKSDLPALASALDKIAELAPPGYTNWASISKDGARAARAGDLTAAKASCRTCHDQYKQKYKTEIRARKI